MCKEAGTGGSLKKKARYGWKRAHECDGRLCCPRSQREEGWAMDGRTLWMATSAAVQSCQQ